MTPTPTNLPDLIALSPGELADELEKLWLDHVGNLRIVPGKADSVDSAQVLLHAIMRTPNIIEALRHAGKPVRGVPSRPIDELHEDHGTVMLLNWNGTDLEDYQIGDLADLVDDHGWTHWVPLPNPMPPLPP